MKYIEYSKFVHKKRVDIVDNLVPVLPTTLRMLLLDAACIAVRKENNPFLQLIDFFKECEKLEEKYNEALRKCEYWHTRYENLAAKKPGEVAK